MSGPKFSEYRLAEQERRRQEAKRKKIIEEEKCKATEKDIFQAKKQLIRLSDKLKVLIENNNEEVYRTRDNIIHDVDKIIEKRVDRKSHSLQKHLTQINRLTRAVDSSIKKYKRIEQEINAVSKYNIRVNKEKQTFDLNAPEKKSHIDLDFTAKEKNFDWYKRDEKAKHRKQSISFGVDDNKIIKHRECTDDVKSNQDNTKKKVIDNKSNLYIVFDSFVDLTKDYYNSDLLINKHEINTLIESVNHIMDDPSIDDNYKISQIEIRKKLFLSTKGQYDKEIDKIKGQKAEYEDLYLTYKTVSKMLNVVPKEYYFDPRNSEDVLNNLKSEMEIANKKLVDEEEAKYISDSINEVMEELGYDILATDHLVTKKRGIIQNIYDFEQGNVINVYTSDNGSLMFEVNGVKESNELTSLEKLKIKEGMEEFCPVYGVIRDKLRKKGIVLANENLLPADEKYARAINLDSKTTVNNKRNRNNLKNTKNKVMSKQNNK